MKKDIAAEYRNKELALEAKLTLANKAYFEKLRSYLVLAGLAYDEASLYKQIYGMVADLLEAQQNGETAVEFFGNEPQQMADELIKNTPIASWKQRFKLFGLLVVIFYFFQLTGDFQASGGTQLNVVAYLLTGLFSYGLVRLIFWSMKKSVYSGRERRYTGLIVIGLVGYTLLIGGIDYLIPNGWQLMIPYPLDLWLVASLMLVAGVMVIVAGIPTYLLMIGFVGMAGLLNRWFAGNGLGEAGWPTVLSFGLIAIGAVATVWLTKRQEVDRYQK